MIFLSFHLVFVGFLLLQVIEGLLFLLLLRERQRARRLNKVELVVVIGGLEGLQEDCVKKIYRN